VLLLTLAPGSASPIHSHPNVSRPSLRLPCVSWGHCTVLFCTVGALQMRLYNSISYAYLCIRRDLAWCLCRRPHGVVPWTHQGQTREAASPLTPAWPHLHALLVWRCQEEVIVSMSGRGWVLTLRAPSSDALLPSRQPLGPNCTATLAPGLVHQVPKGTVQQYRFAALRLLPACPVRHWHTSPCLTCCASSTMTMAPCDYKTQAATYRPSCLCLLVTGCVQAKQVVTG